MKLILIATILSLALANSFYLRVPGLATPVSDSAPACITAYMTAFFAHFGLDQPKQILNCFDDKSAALYFKNVYEVANLVHDAEDRQRVHVHADWLKLAVLHKQLSKLDGCIGQTQDLTNLLEALGAKERNPELYALINFIYYQANLGKLAGSLPQVTGALNNRNFTAAGDSAAAILSTTAEDIKKTGVALQALNGLWNGVHIGLGLPDAKSVWKCWTNETADIRLEFIYGLSAAVANGNKKDAAENTKTYYEQTGKALIEKIPTDAWKCWAESDDTKSESAKLNIDITSKEFYARVTQYVERHGAAYWGLQKGIKDSMEQHNFLHAGSAYAHLLQAAAATN